MPPFDKGSFVASGILALLVLTMLLVSFDYPPAAREVPLIVGIPTLFFLAASMGAEFFPRTLRGLEMGIETIWGGTGPQNGGLSQTAGMNWGSFSRVIGWLVFFFVALFYLGLLTGAILFVCCFLLIEGKTRWYSALAASAIIWTVLYVLVYRGLMLRLWPGAIPELIPAVLGGGVVPPL